MIQNPLPQMGTAGVEQGPTLSPVAERPILTMVPHIVFNLDQCHKLLFNRPRKELVHCGGHMNAGPGM